uniref:Tyrosinase_Cu-bd domain-containing protein n=1 Tax=Heterorhabditis bacteriophora TaxID=37862 RepID=A0A1I7XHG2_HETBA
MGYSFSNQRSVLLNGNLYTETLDQPWFRVFHPPHLPIPDKLVNETAFGKHELPPDDIYAPHEWTEEEKKYLPCLDLKCVCPYYSGKAVGSKCILQNGKLLKKAIRKEIRTLTDSERMLVENALNKMKSAGIYDRISFVHKYGGMHEGPGFFTWHREYLKRAELIFRRFLPMGSQLGIPYWDSSLESHLPEPKDSLFFSNIFVGSTNENGYVNTGPYAHWNIMEGTRPVRRFIEDNSQGEVLNDARIDLVLNQTDINAVLAAVLPLEVFRNYLNIVFSWINRKYINYRIQSCPIIIRDDRLLEYSHDYVHYFINGDMKQTFSSSSETREERESAYPPAFPNCYPQKHFADSRLEELEPYTNQDALSNKYTDFMYAYEQRPKCDAAHGCDSRYLFCYTNKNDQSRCMAKVRRGGNCAGFEGTDICYEGYCKQGICINHNNHIDKYVMM